MASIRISSITFEHHPSGFGVGNSRPRISWRFSTSDDTKNWVQESYEIQIDRHDNAEPKTFRVNSSESVLVPWPDRVLQSREAAVVKVRSYGKVTDDTGSITNTSTEWSASTNVEAALLENGDWTAKLATSTLKPDKNQTARPLLFRKVFAFPEGAGPIVKARLHITAYGVYEAFINGQRVGSDEMAPGWTSYGHRLLYQTFDVAQMLDASHSNVLGVEVAEGWYAGRIGMDQRRFRYGDRLAFLAQLEVVFESGQTHIQVSDDTWKWHNSATCRSEIYDGEDYDSRAEQLGWYSDPQFDEHAWVSAEELPFPASKLVASDTPPVRQTEELRPIKIFKSSSGKCLIDFGQNLVGKLSVRLPVAGVTANVDEPKLSFSHAEVLENNELGTRPLRGAKPIDNVILSNTQIPIWSPKFTFHGFRYVQVDGWPADDGMPGSSDIKALVLHSDMRRTGWFSCSDAQVNRLHENVVWSMKGNFFSIPTDCPQRDERLGWTGDIQVFSPSASFIFDTQGFLGSWLEDVAAEQLEDGKNGVPGLVVPDVFDPPVPPGPQCAWHDVAVLTPWDLYTSSGDVEILRRQYESMKAWVDQGIKRGPNGLWDQNVWQYGDWLDPAAPPSEPGLGRTDSLLVADAYLVRVLETISKASALLGETEDAERYSQDARNTRKTFGDEYITPSGLLVGDTQTAHSLAISFGLFDQQDHIKKSAGRLAHLVHTSKYHIATGFVGTPLITHALSDTGNYQLAYRMLLEKSCPSWLYPITMGATTIWERWDSMLPDGSINPGMMTSFNHYALGSVAHWLHKNVGGISPLTPGWRTIMVRPLPGGTITSATISYESPYGRIECSWNINDTDGAFSMRLVVPPSSQAVVILPSDWNEAGHDGTEKSSLIGSGTYNFSCAYQPAEWPPKPEFSRSTYHLEV